PSSVPSCRSAAPEQRIRICGLCASAGWEKRRMHHPLTRMSKRGLVERERCGSRGMDAVLPDAGMEALTSAVPCHTQVVRRLFIDPLTPEELDQFAELSGTVLENLRSEQ